MTARTASLTAALALGLVGCGGGIHEVSIETPLQPKLDISAFSRVLIAGFVAGGTDEVDANLETARLLRSQLRNRSDLQIVETDVLSLMEMVADGSVASGFGDVVPLVDPAEITQEQDLEAYERVFADIGFWKQLGEEHQETVDRDRHRAVHAAFAGWIHYPGAGIVRFVWPAPCRAGARLPRAPRVRAQSEIHLHRRTDGHHALLRVAPRGNSLRRQAEYACPVVVFRTDGPADPDVP